MTAILLLSGPLAVGKTTLADELIVRNKFEKISTSDYLKGLLANQGLEATRTRLQDLGDRLDLETDFTWVVDPITIAALHNRPGQKFWLLDSVRKRRQIEHFRSSFGNQIAHVHLTAPEDELERRYNLRLASAHAADGSQSYQSAIVHENERAARELINVANLTIDVTLMDAPEAATQIISFLDRI